MVNPDAHREAHLIMPSAQAYLRYARAAIGGILPILWVGLAGWLRIATGHHPLQLVGLVFAIVAPPYVVVFFHLKLARIGWNDVSAWKTTLLGKKTIPRSEIEGIAFRSVTPALSLTPREKMVVYGARRHILLTVQCAYWSIGDLREFEYAVGAGTPDRFFKPVRQKEFNREFPTGGNWLGRHPNLLGVIVGLFITVLICLGIAAMES
jgi:hypothetical protein